MVRIGRNCFRPMFRLHAVPRQSPPIVSPVRWSCLEVWPTLIQSIPGRTMERRGLCSRRALNFPGCMELAPLIIRYSVRLWFLAVETVAWIRTPHGSGMDQFPIGDHTPVPNGHSHAKVMG